jgi:hypothetical protein
MWANNHSGQEDNEMKKIVPAVLALALALGFSCSMEKTSVMVPSEGQVCFQVVPNSAEVYVDGKNMGKSSQFEKGECLVLDLGKHNIQILAAGFESYNEDINVGQAKQFFRARLAKAVQTPEPGK